MQIQDLSTEILVRIFKRLNYRERIRIELVCPKWRTISLDTWKDQRILRFSREMLHLDEPNSIVNEQNELDPLEAVIRRCAPFLDELHLLDAFDMPVRFGHILSQLTHPFGRLAHLHITAQLGASDLRTIQCHLAPQLLSLAVVTFKDVLNNPKNAFKELLANCNKLENLKIVTFHYYHNLFGIGEVDQGSQPSSSLALTTTTTSCCSFMPSTLKYLLIDEGHWCGDPRLRVNALLSLLAHCSQLRYMPILICAFENAPVLQHIEEKNPREFDKIISLQIPFFIANHDSFPYIKRPEFRNLKALHVDFRIGPEKIHQIAKCCPQLEHLGIRLSYWREDEDRMEIQDLVALHQFKQLSSLEILIQFGYYNDFHKVFCPDGERADMAFLDILTQLDQIHPLRSLDFKGGDDYRYPTLSEDYLFQMSNQLKHLETFSCSFYLKIDDIDDRAEIGQFCERLRKIFDTQGGANKKSFKFRLMADGNECRETKNLLVEWQKGSDCRPLTWCDRGHRNYDFKPARSIVLNELITSQFGQITSSMLFDSFGMMEEEEH